MIKKAQAFLIAEPTVTKLKKHKDYKHVTELTNDYYRPLITGYGTEKLLKQFNLREDEELFEQRKRLTEVITPAICNTIITPSRKVPGVRPISDSIFYEPSNRIEDVKKLRNAISHFYGDKDVDFYLATRITDLSAIDPNAFILTVFENFDHRYESPDIIATEVLSCDAWDYQYVNGELQYITIHRDIEYKTSRQNADYEFITQKGHLFVIYADNDHIQFEQVDPEFLGIKKGFFKQRQLYDSKMQPVTVEDATTGNSYYYFSDRDTLYQVDFFEHKSGEVPAVRIGYIPDQHTNGRTCVSLIHPALSHLKKSVKTVSELDLSESLHAFPRLFIYYPPCKGESDAIGCLKGLTNEGTTCRVCNGMGYVVHRSSQDHIGYQLPKNPDQMFDLEKVAHYMHLPIDILKHLNEKSMAICRDALKAVYSSDIFSRDEITATATAKNIEMQSVYDALSPFGEHYAYMRNKQVRITASYINVRQGLVVTYRLPRNLKFENLNDLFNMLKLADSASEEVRLQINSDIVDHLYRDDLQALEKIKVQQRLNPFVGKSEGIILSIINQDLCTKEMAVSWTAKKIIFDELELNNEDFYQMSFAKQKELFDQVVKRIVKEIEDAKPEAPALPKLEVA